MPEDTTMLLACFFFYIVGLVGRAVPLFSLDQRVHLTAPLGVEIGWEMQVAVVFS